MLTQCSFSEDFPGGLFQCRQDEPWTLVSASETFFRFLGYTRESFQEKCGNSLRAVMYEADKAILQTEFAQPSARTVALGFRLVCQKGDFRWVWCNAAWCTAEGLWNCVFTDMTERMTLSSGGGAMLTPVASVPEAWSRERKIWKNLLDTLPCGVAVFLDDPDVSIVQANRTAIQLLGYERDTFWHSPRHLAEYIHPEYLNVLQQSLAHLHEPSAGSTVGVDCPLFTEHGTILWVHSTIRLLETLEGVSRYQCVFTDITEQKRAELKFADASMQDSLTGLYNRRAFEALVSKRLLQDSEKISAFLILDLDDFKKANDVFGHAYGDEILLTLSDILKTNLRKSDLIGRLGGDEFVIFMENVFSERNVWNKIQEMYEAVHRHGPAQEGFVLSASIGVALVPQHGTTFQELYLNADRALYQAKEQGKSKACFA